MALSDKEFKSMQQDAAERVREMRRRSRELISGGEKHTPPYPQHEKNDSTEGTTERRPQSNNQKSSPFRLEELLSQFKIDEEKALIAMIIYILAKNGADVKLLIGLGYLLL